MYGCTCTNKLTSRQARFASFPCLASLAAHAGDTLGTSDPRRASLGDGGRPVRAVRSLQPLRTRRPNFSSGAVVATLALGSLVTIQSFGPVGAVRSRWARRSLGAAASAITLDRIAHLQEQRFAIAALAAERRRSAAVQRHLGEIVEGVLQVLGEVLERLALGVERLALEPVVLPVALLVGVHVRGIRLVVGLAGRGRGPFDATVAGGIGRGISRLLAGVAW